MKLPKGLLLLGVFVVLAMNPVMSFAQENTSQNGWDIVKDALYPVLFSEEDAKKFSEQTIAHKGEPPLFKPLFGDLTVGYIMIRQEDKVFLLPSHLKNLGPSVTLDEIHDTAKNNLQHLASGSASSFIMEDSREKHGIDTVTLRSKNGWQARLTPSFLLLHEKLFSLSDALLGGLFKEKKYYTLPMRYVLPITTGSQMRSGFLDFIAQKVRLDKKDGLLLSEYIYEISSDGVVPLRKVQDTQIEQ